MRVDFYHLQNTGLDNALPKLVEKAYLTGERILIQTDLAQQADFLNTLLWTYDKDSFLPHGVEKDGFCEKQPILITHKEKFNPNGAKICIVLDGLPVPDTEDFIRVLYVFNGRDNDSVNKAREEWKRLSATSCERFYWQQNENGQWQNKV